jgi:hypothetical protein
LKLARSMTSRRAPHAAPLHMADVPRRLE